MVNSSISEKSIFDLIKWQIEFLGYTTLSDISVKLSGKTTSVTEDPLKMFAPTSLTPSGNTTFLI